MDKDGSGGGGGGGGGGVYVKGTFVELLVLSNQTC